MLRHPHIRLLLVVIVCVTLMVGSAKAEGFEIISTGQAVAILVGAAVVIGLVVYLVIPKQKTIEGCVESADNSLKLRDKDGKTYVLESKGITIQPGQHVKMKGKRGKDKSGAPSLRVTKIVRDFGACTPSAIK